MAPPPRHRDVRVRRRGHRRRARRPARPDHHGHRGCCRAAVPRAPGPAGRRAGPGQDRRGAARRGRAAADPLAVRLGAELDPLPGRGGGRAFPRVPDARGAGAADAAGRRGRVRRALRHRAGPPHRADDPHAAGDPRLHLAGQPARRRHVGRELGRLAGITRLPAHGAARDRHHRHRARARHLPGRLGRRRPRPRVPAGRPADHGPARGIGASRCRRRRHARVDLVRPQAEPRRAGRPDRRCRRGRPRHARPGISAGHVRGDRAGPGQRRRTRRDRAHRVRPGSPR